MSLQMISFSYFSLPKLVSPVCTVLEVVSSLRGLRWIPEYFLSIIVLYHCVRKLLLSVIGIVWTMCTIDRLSGKNKGAAIIVVGY